MYHAQETGCNRACGQVHTFSSGINAGTLIVARNGKLCPAAKHLKLLAYINQLLLIFL